MGAAPQGIAAKLHELLDQGTIGPRAQVSNPQLWGSWLEFAVPELTYAVDSRIELFPAEVWTKVNAVENTNGEWLSALDNLAPDVVLVDWNNVDLYDGLKASDRWLMCAARENEGWVFIVAPRDRPGIPGRRQHIPRTTSTICTPARPAS